MSRLCHMTNLVHPGITSCVCVYHTICLGGSHHRPSHGTCQTQKFVSRLYWLVSYMLHTAHAIMVQVPIRDVS